MKEKENQKERGTMKIVKLNIESKRTQRVKENRGSVGAGDEIRTRDFLLGNYNLV